MILIIDFGSQTTHLIGRRLRSLGIDINISAPDTVLSEVKKLKPKGIILSGGPDFVDRKEAPTINPKIFTMDLPVLGICYGWQLMSYLLGGQGKVTNKEFGPETVRIKSQKSIFNLPQKEFTAIISHGYTVTKLPPGFQNIASTKSVLHTGALNKSKKLFGVQFHPEAYHTEQGLKLLENFVGDVCGEKINLTALNPKTIIAEIKKQVDDRPVICAVSGGVDSTVAAFLIGKAIGHRLIPVYIESGLMRPGSHKRVKDILNGLLGIEPVIVRAEKQFLKSLRGLTDPEDKRKTIGKLYIDLFQQVAGEYKNVGFLGQGTIYSDVIESRGTKLASKIKSHHNVGGLPKSLKLKLVEPLRNYYKDEVRELGKLLGLPIDVINEQPFPGPGYAVRIRGEVTEGRLAKEKLADAIVIEEIQKSGLWEKIFQCFAVMTGAFSTAVKGDERFFGEVVAVRAYESVDIMTSRWAHLPFKVLAQISTRIVNEVPGISRVVYDISTKPPATMEWE